MITNQLHHLCAMSANMSCYISRMKIDLKKRVRLLLVRKEGIIRIVPQPRAMLDQKQGPVSRLHSHHFVAWLVTQFAVTLDPLPLYLVLPPVGVVA
jgi:hypothetical protein